MRRVLPWLANMVAVLLLMQWAGAAPACLASARSLDAAWPGPVICHTGHAPASPQQGPGHHHHGGMDCPACAPLSPGLLPTMPAVVPPGAAAAGVQRPLVVAQTRAPEAHPTPQQPRAPPARP